MLISGKYTRATMSINVPVIYFGNDGTPLHTTPGDCIGGIDIDREHNVAFDQLRGGRAARHVIDARHHGLPGRGRKERPLYTVP